MAESIVSERLTYPGPNGDVKAYLARPTGGQPWPAIVVIQEVFGLVPHIEDVARRFAGEGYLALAPDMYSHDQVRPTIPDEAIIPALGLRMAQDKEAAIAQLPADQRDAVRRAADWLTNRDASTYVPDLRAAVDWLKARPDVRANAIGSIGYCMGGGLSGQLATSGADIAAAVIYYGAAPPLDQVGNVRCAVQGHYGGEDPGITNQVPKFEEAMKAAGKDITTFVYDGAPHAFFNDTRPSFRGDASKTAWERTLDFFQRHLKGVPAGAR
jgi:carboxymethylenebutenolidase